MATLMPKLQLQSGDDLKVLKTIGEPLRRTANGNNLLD